MDIYKYLLLLDPKNSMHLNRAQLIFDYGKLLKLAKGFTTSLEFTKSLSEPKRLGKYIYTLVDKDDVSKSFEIMKSLYEHDPKERDKYFNLMVAMSVVWDQKHFHIEADIQLYLKYTKEPGQTKRALIFLRRFLRGSRYNSLKQYLAEAYRNNGDESRASKIK